MRLQYYWKLDKNIPHIAHHWGILFTSLTLTQGIKITLRRGVYDFTNPPPPPPPPRPTPWDVINERSLNFSVIILFLEEIWGDSKENRTRWYYVVSCKLCQSVAEQNGFLPLISGCKRLFFYSCSY